MRGHRGALVVLVALTAFDFGCEAEGRASFAADPVSAAEHEARIVVVIADDGGVSVDGVPVDLEGLAAVAQRARESAPEREVAISITPAVPFHRLEEVVEILRGEDVDIAIGLRLR